MAGSRTYRSQERVRSSNPGIFGAVFGVVMCSALFLVVTGVILKFWLNVPYENVVSSLFEGVDEAAYNQGVGGSLAILAGIAAIALTLRGMSWRSRDLPTDPSLHRAWLQKILEDSARESWAFGLLVVLSSLYGAVVVSYGLLAGYAGWPGVSRVFLIFLSVMYVVVATLPAFVPKSEIGTIKGYVEALVSLANLGEWRYFNFFDSTFNNSNGGRVRSTISWRVLRALCVEDIKWKWHYVVRFSGVWGTATVFVVLVLVAFVESGFAGAGVNLKVLLYMILVCLLPEAMLVWMLGVRCRIISAGKSDVAVVVEVVYIALISALIWWFQWYVMPGFLFKNVVVVLFLWWCVRAILAFTIKSERRRRCPSRFWERLEVVIGLRCVMGVWVDQALQATRNQVGSYSDVNLPVVDELAAVANLVVPKECVVNRGRDDGQVESTNLRKYLSEVVKVTLPTVPESGSGAGKQGEGE
ncbi:Uncharacterised protein [Actinomyces viscosus]|uniref:Uncharacterized protein n=2 Tax=Actinomyces viscosus TaxID=1656 RepID=A0A448PL32_ACTVI|nr:Uncharacterised protein [Actinomyces viscosus]